MTSVVVEFPASVYLLLEKRAKRAGRTAGAQVVFEVVRNGGPAQAALRLAVAGQRARAGEPSSQEIADAIGMSRQTVQDLRTGLPTSWIATQKVLRYLAAEAGADDALVEGFHRLWEAAAAEHRTGEVAPDAR